MVLFEFLELASAQVPGQFHPGALSVDVFDNNKAKQASIVVGGLDEQAVVLRVPELSDAGKKINLTESSHISSPGPILQAACVQPLPDTPERLLAFLHPDSLSLHRLRAIKNMNEAQAAAEDRTLAVPMVTSLVARVAFGFPAHSFFTYPCSLLPAEFFSDSQRPHDAIFIWSLDCRLLVLINQSPVLVCRLFPDVLIPFPAPAPAPSSGSLIVSGGENILYQIPLSALAATAAVQQASDDWAELIRSPPLLALHDRVVLTITVPDDILSICVPQFTTPDAVTAPLVVTTCRGVRAFSLSDGSLLWWHEFTGGVRLTRAAGVPAHPAVLTLTGDSFLRQIDCETGRVVAGVVLPRGAVDFAVAQIGTLRGALTVLTQTGYLAVGAFGAGEDLGKSHSVDSSALEQIQRECDEMEAVLAGKQCQEAARAVPLEVRVESDRLLIDTPGTDAALVLSAENCLISRFEDHAQASVSLSMDSPVTVYISRQPNAIGAPSVRVCAFRESSVSTQDVALPPELVLIDCEPVDFPYEAECECPQPLIGTTAQLGGSVVSFSRHSIAANSLLGLAGALQIACAGGASFRLTGADTLASLLQERKDLQQAVEVTHAEVTRLENEARGFSATARECGRHIIERASPSLLLLLQDACTQLQRIGEAMAEGMAREEETRRRAKLLEWLLSSLET